jgi:8-oxo-dGTP pyrophosphatase MutT (NUDIX family)
VAERLHGATSQLLGQHDTVDAQELEHLRRMRLLLETGSEPFARTHLSPGHFTASAFVVSEDRQRVLLILHRKLKRWLQPGGHIDADDDGPLAAAIREVREETGLNDVRPLGEGLLDVDVHAIPALGNEPPHEHFDLRFCLTTSEAGAEGSDEIDGLAWVPLSEITKVHTDASVWRAASRLARRFAV